MGVGGWVGGMDVAEWVWVAGWDDTMTMRCHIDELLIQNE